MCKKELHYRIYLSLSRLTLLNILHTISAMAITAYSNQICKHTHKFTEFTQTKHKHLLIPINHHLNVCCLPVHTHQELGATYIIHHRKTTQTYRIHHIHKTLTFGRIEHDD